VVCFIVYYRWVEKAEFSKTIGDVANHKLISLKGGKKSDHLAG